MYKKIEKLIGEYKQKEDAQLYIAKNSKNAIDRDKAFDLSIEYSIFYNKLQKILNFEKQKPVSRSDSEAISL